nr:MAG TPA: hypothetical protein [Caudoviricetes sp.]
MFKRVSRSARSSFASFVLTTCASTTSVAFFSISTHFLPIDMNPI